MDFVKEDTLLGTKKVIVGDKFHDLVLENLGKIYIRYGNSYKEFNSILNAIVVGAASGGSRIIIEADGISDDLSIYPNGSLVYDAKSGTLYLIYDGEALILAEHINTNSNRFVLKTGDTMTGQLVINTKGAPLKVKSSDLVKNFNANYLQGYDASAFARRNYDETINGNWTFTGRNTFTNKNTFEDTAIFTGTGEDAAIRVGTGDIITDGSLGSSTFISGMNGSGWRLDAETNTLEIDNLIVRGILNVYELVVNKVSATNGALWITDSFKVKTVHDLVKIEYSSGRTIDSVNFSTEKYYIIYQNVSQEQVLDSFMAANAANGFLDTYNCAKITVNGECFSTRTRKETEGAVVMIHKLLFQVLNVERFKSVCSANNYTLQDLCKSSILYTLQNEDKVIDVTCIYQYNTKDIPDKMVSYNDVFNEKFDTHRFKIVTNPTYDESNKKYYYENNGDLATINLYYKYFGGGELYVLESENDEYPVFKPGDIIRCQKFTGQSVKQYHAIVCGTVGEYGIIFQLQSRSILNRKVEIAYDEEGNLKQYDVSIDDELYSRSHALLRGEQGGNLNPEQYNDGIKNLNSKESTEAKHDVIEDIVENDRASADGQSEFERLCVPQEGDGLVRVGSIVWGDRRNSMYLTSSENYSPFQDILVGVNRPDYGVVYFTPKIRKCTVQMMIDEENEIYKEQEVYLQNTQFCQIMDLGFQYLEEIERLRELDQESQEYIDAVGTYDNWASGSDGQIFTQYKDVVQRIDVPKSQSDKGDQEFYGLTNVKDVYLTYTENTYEPKYYNRNGERIKVSAKVTSQNSSFYTAPKLDNQPIKVIQVNKGVNKYEKTVYQSEGSQSKILAIGWRI